MNKYLFVFTLTFKVLLIVNFKHVGGNESCWNNEKECNIKAELFQNLKFSNGISMQIDCMSNLIEPREEDQQQIHFDSEQERIINENHQTSTNYLLLRRFMGIQAVMLDGCQTPLNTHTFGLEFLPICVNITSVALSHFHMDTLIPLNCNVNEETPQDEPNLQLEYLNIQFNEIAEIDGESFRQNYPQLRDILIESNSLKAIQTNAFKSLRSLENVRIVNEPVLMLKSADLFEYTSVLAIHLEALKQMTSEIFQHLPETLQNFYVADTQLDNEAAVVVRNALVLKNLTIKNCALQEFTLHDVHSTVERINLSGNVIKMFMAYENNLNELDLSNNQLEYFPIEWLKNLTNLKTLILKGNQIQVVSLNNVLHALPKGHIVDLRGNRLQNLHDYDIELEDVLVSQMRLKCDRNPWDCLWLHDFAHQYPEKFRILQYEKFISKINVNGLECIPAEKPLYVQLISHQSSTMASSTFAPVTTATEKIMNVSTYNLVYGNPWDFKRNQRAEALIIVFMLPLGIALLFLLLYMWIYCQKMFHLSYYQNFSCMRSPAVPNPSQRFDVVRQLPPIPKRTDARLSYPDAIHDDHDEGYEVPLNGVVSECNCKAQQCNTIEKCNKTIHITYEQLPTDEPHQIYEEIIHVEEEDDDDNDHKNAEHNADSKINK